MTAMTFGTARDAVAGEVRAELGRKRLSGRELARRTGKNQAYWGRRIAGAVAFDVDDLVTVAEFLDVPVTDLFRGVVPTSSLTRTSADVQVATAWALAATAWELAA